MLCCGNIGFSTEARASSFCLKYLCNNFGRKMYSWFSRKIALKLFLGRQTRLASVVCAGNFRINRFMFQSNDLNGCPSIEKGSEQEMKGKSVSNSFSEIEGYLFIIILRNCSFYLYLFKNSNLFIYSFYENNSRMFCFSSGIIKKNILNINILFVIFLHTNILDIVLLNIT